MSGMETLSSSPDFVHILKLLSQHSVPLEAKEDIFDNDPAEIVDMALAKLQEIGVKLIEWRALLHRRMGVPVMVKNYSYLVPDEDLVLASKTLSDMGLPVAPATPFSVRTEGDFRTQGRFHRITRSTSGFLAQHITLYPLSFSTILESEVEERPPLHTIPGHSRCPSIFAPPPPAVYASIIRMMLRYPRGCSTMYCLQSDLDQLISYGMLHLDGYVDPDDDEGWEALGMERRLAEGVARVRTWGADGVWREGEEWIGDALGAVVGGSASSDTLPCKS